MKKLSVTYVKPKAATPIEAISSSPIYTVPQDNLGRGVAMDIDAYIDAQIAHPSIIGVMHNAVKNPGQAVVVETDDVSAIYFAEVGQAVAAEGFTFKIEAQPGA